MLAVVLAASLLAPRAFAQSPEELQAARDLFQEAFKDEQEKRFPDALEKFQRVARVKESASVRYRIATVLAGMGRLREARDMYRALAATKASLPPSDQETADSAAEKVVELDGRIPRLAVRVEDDAPADVRVTVDGAPVPVSTAPRAVDLDPGEHIVAATARGYEPTERSVTLADGGGEVAHTVKMMPERRVTRTDDTLGWIALGGGAALVAAGAVLLVARESAIDDVEAACPGNICPTSRRAEVESDRDRAHLFGPLGAGVGLVGLAAVGAGVYLLLRAPPSDKARAALVMPSPGGARFAFTF
ncbi:MAG: hypothetical protein KF795_29300 [Labilithrix sp.]|nr:hypothetical protein [Labilithrix sp.]